MRRGLPGTHGEGAAGKEETGCKAYSFELVQTCTDQGLGSRMDAVERGHLHSGHLCAAPASSCRRTSCPVQRAGDKIFHRHKDGAGVGGVHQSLNVDNSVYKQSVDHTRHVCKAGVSLDLGCNMWSQQNSNRKWQGQRPGRGGEEPLPRCHASGHASSKCYLSYEMSASAHVCVSARVCMNLIRI